MVSAKTISEKILSIKSGSDARAGDVVVCVTDQVIGTDASAPMAIDYFEQMDGDRLFDASRVMFALDHYAPPTSPVTASYHARVREFAARFGAEVREVGEGISHQVAAESGRALPGNLIVGADSHTVGCGALNLFATGVGSSDLAAAMLTGQIWLRVPDSVRVVLSGRRGPGVAAKDVGLALIAALGADGANYRALEFHGEALGGFTLEERVVLCNLAVETGAKAAICPVDQETHEYLAGRTTDLGRPVHADAGARYVREVTLDVSNVAPQLAVPHAPDRVVPLDAAAGTPVHMVFIGTCTGGRVADIHDALRVLERGGGRLAPNVQLVVTPASREVFLRLIEDGSLGRLAALGAVITTPGCGACCGTSGVVPADDMVVLSTANRNFRGRMGNSSAAIYLASPAACAAAAVTGRITDPRTVHV